jgi:hypothetical protein
VLSSIERTTKRRQTVSEREALNNLRLAEQIRAEVFNSIDDRWTWAGQAEVMIHAVSRQRSASFFENAFIGKLGLERVSKASRRGDARDSAGRHYELKHTVITETNDRCNFVQIRVSEVLEGYHLFVIDSFDDYRVYHFYLSATDMHDLQLSVAHSAGSDINKALRIGWYGNEMIEFKRKFLVSDDFMAEE